MLPPIHLTSHLISRLPDAPTLLDGWWYISLPAWVMCILLNIGVSVSNFIHIMISNSPASPECPTVLTLLNALKLNFKKPIFLILVYIPDLVIKYDFCNHPSVVHVIHLSHPLPSRTDRLSRLLLIPDIQTCCYASWV